MLLHYRSNTGIRLSEKGENGHDETANADVGREPFPYPREFPEHAEEYVLIFSRVYHARDNLSDVGTGADEEEDAQEEGVEVEQGGHGYCYLLWCSGGGRFSLEVVQGLEVSSLMWIRAHFRLGGLASAAIN